MVWKIENLNEYYDFKLDIFKSFGVGLYELVILIKDVIIIDLVYLWVEIEYIMYKDNWSCFVFFYKSFSIVKVVVVGFVI